MTTRRRQVVAAVLATARPGDAGQHEVDDRDRQLIESRLDEVVAAGNPAAALLLRTAMRALAGWAWRVRADPEQVRELRGLVGGGPVVFVPAHRSYADPVVLNAVLRPLGFREPHVLAGTNLRFWPLGPLGRAGNMVFIRRRFGDDPHYKAAVRAYCAYLLAQGTDLLFWVEGTRSRTGLLGRARVGVLRYLMDALDSGAVPEVRVIPISLTYDLLREVAGFSAEQRGERKKAEHFATLVRLAWAHRRRRGVVEVRFGPSLPMRPGTAAGTDVESLARLLCARINDCTPVVPAALISLVLLGAEGVRWNAESIHRLVLPLAELVRERGFPAAGLAELNEVSGVEGHLERLVDAGALDRHSATGYALPDERRVVAAYYRNQSVHWFLPRALAELVLARTARPPGAERLAAARRELGRVVALLSGAVQGWSDDDLHRLAWEEFVLLDRLTDGRHADPSWIAAAVLPYFLESRHVVAHLLADRGTPEDTGSFLAECRDTGARWAEDGLLRLPEAVSLPLYADALDALAPSGQDGPLPTGPRGPGQATGALSELLTQIHTWSTGTGVERTHQEMER